MDATWDGITRAYTLHAEEAATRHELADSAKAYDWPRTLAILGERPELINTIRPDGESLFTPLHQAAHGGAPIKVVRRLLRFGAWRTLPNQRGERPLDVAQRQAHPHLWRALTPVYRRRVAAEELRQIQAHFHDLIRSRASKHVDDEQLRLPELEVLLELRRPRMWFAVPGMYGGFRFWLTRRQSRPALISESWCRVVEGSGQRHEVSSEGSELTADGFV